MSFCRTAYSCLSSHGRSTCMPRRISGFCGIKIPQQTTRNSACRILQTYKPVRGLFTFTNRSYCMGKENSTSNHESNEVDQTRDGKLESSCQQKLRSWSFQVNPFNKIVIRTPFNAIVKPLSPLEYPEADKAFVTLTLTSAKEIDNSRFETVAQSIQAGADFQDGNLLVGGSFLESMNAELEKQDASVLWQAEVPISFDADIETTGHGNIVLEKLENQTCVVKSEHGNCHLNKIKSGFIKVSSTSGNISSKKVLQGNAVISTQGSGSISTGRLQGQTCVLSSEAGTISCKDLYAVQVGVKTTSGQVEIINAHGQCDIITDSGNVNIGSLDGCLNAVTDSGNIDAYLVKHKEVSVASQKGDVSLKVPSDVKSTVHLEAPTVSVAQELHTESVAEDHSSHRILFGGTWNNEEDNKLTAVTKQGSITVAVQSWFDSLKLTK